DTYRSGYPWSLGNISTTWKPCRKNILQKFIQDKLVVVGDFNINFFSNQSQTCCNLMARIGLKSSLPDKAISTTGNTMIDNCFTNVETCTAGFIDAPFSYHKPLRIIV
ncbi:unnamed protein product, partial [Allacma fusca]